MPGGFIAIFALVATGAVLWLALIFRADARDWRRMRERMRHQRAPVDVKPWGDVPRIPTIEQPRGE